MTMKETILKFLKEYYKPAVELKEVFKITEKKQWNETTVLMELYVQIGHMGLLIGQDKDLINYSLEVGRNIHSYEDEISDVLLQLIALSNKLKINLEEELGNYTIEHMKFDNTSDLEITNSIVVLVGQITEAIMEKKEYRHFKQREKFNSLN
ncbi:MAG: hypothetical protein A2Y24_01290 [Clostridiales bacterium GWE2_32_10]|nr:MAG: hypothetical protein A2Y24_01290 [Clostridiales bacterium GWE2_32_10]HBY20640.1 hypothetical protein [Clostridiales bacterium]